MVSSSYIRTFTSWGNETFAHSNRAKRQHAHAAEGACWAGTDTFQLTVHDLEAGAALHLVAR